jgi:predicted RNase H-like HicB family nuclease
MTTYNVTLRREQGQRFLAECSEVPGCVSTGRNEAEAIANLKEAIIAWMWDAKRFGTPLMSEPVEYRMSA